MHDRTRERPVALPCEVCVPSIVLRSQARHLSGGAHRSLVQTCCEPRKRRSDTGGRGPAMSKLKSMDELFEGRHFDREAINWLLVSTLILYRAVGPTRGANRCRVRHAED